MMKLNLSKFYKYKQKLKAPKNEEMAENGDLLHTAFGHQDVQCLGHTLDTALDP